VIPIPGTKRIKYLEENLGALKLKLTDEDNKRIRKAIDAREATGDRYPPGFAVNLFADTPEL
jgi:aryl-alcohol dehydrogenase-like predicted oxidoreductase